MEVPEIRHLTEIGSDHSKSMQVRTTVDAMIANVSDYLTKILATKGSRSTIDQRTYRTVVAACSGSNLREKKLMGYACRILVLCCVCTPILLLLVDVLSNSNDQSLK